MEYSCEAPENSEASFNDLLEGTISTIRNRLSDKNYTEANVQSFDNGIDSKGIRVEIPDVQDDTVLELIGETAKMSFIDPDGNEFMTGDMVKVARPEYQDGQYRIAFQLTEEGKKLFGDVTAANVGKNIKIVLDYGTDKEKTLVDATVNEDGHKDSGPAQYPQDRRRPQNPAAPWIPPRPARRSAAL